MIIVSLIILLLFGLLGFFVIGRYFYRKFDEDNQREIDALSSKIDAALPLLNRLITENVPIPSPYDPNHSTVDDRVYDDSIDRKILGENFTSYQPTTPPTPELIELK